MRQSTVDRPLIMETNPNSYIAEAYRTLRTNINYSSIDGDIQVILVNSALPGEGKSTTAVNLAAAYAQSGKKTLILDADLRKPAIHRVFQLSNRSGLSGILTGLATKAETIRSGGMENLMVLTSGLTPPNPAELLGSQKMKLFLEELRQEYDVIILDTPPSLAVADAQILASLSDGVILVLDSGRVKKDLVRKAKGNLQQTGARLLGVVLNGVSNKDKDAYQYYYGGGEA